MADGYRAVLAVAAEQGSPPWGELIRSVLPAAFRGAGLDWEQTEHVRSGRGLLISAPAAAAGRLAGGFVQELADSLAALGEPVRLGLGLAVGMCDRDSRGWYGEAVAAAWRLAEPATDDDVRLAIGAGLAAELGADVAEVRTASGTRPGPDSPAGLDAAAPDSARLDAAAPDSARLDAAAPDSAQLDAAAPGSAAGLIAAAVEAVAAPVAAFAEQLPVLLAPDVAPSDVLGWMYRALGVDSPLLLDDRHGRRLLSGLVRCYQRRGTARGLAELVELRYGVGVEILDPGSATWSAVPETPVRRPAEAVTVLLDTDEPLDGLDEVIRSALPVGVGYRVSRRPRRAGPVR